MMKQAGGRKNQVREHCSVHWEIIPDGTVQGKFIVSKIVLSYHAAKGWDDQKRAFCVCNDV